MKITTLSNGNVRLHYYEVGSENEVTGVSRDFFVNDRSVMEWVARDSTRQVCVGLESMGSTLTCRDESQLPGLIRREYQAMKRSADAYRRDDRDDEARRRGCYLNAVVFEGDILSVRHPLVKAYLANEA